MTHASTDFGHVAACCALAAIGALIVVRAEVKLEGTEIQLDGNCARAVGFGFLLLAVWMMVSGPFKWWSN
jgi:hypothetical protein